MSTKKLQVVGTVVPKSDWNETDETSSTYIKNKPFYEDPTRQETISNNIVTGVPISDIPLGDMFEFTPMHNLVFGAACTITIGNNSMEFNVVSDVFEEMTVLTIGDLYSNINSGGVPTYGFIVGEVNGFGIIGIIDASLMAATFGITEDALLESTISIAQTYTRNYIKQIDKKFIPDSNVIVMSAKQAEIANFDEYPIGTVVLLVSG